MRIDTGGNETNVLWLDLTAAEAAELRDALLAGDGMPHERRTGTSTFLKAKGS